MRHPPTYIRDDLPCIALLVLPSALLFLLFHVFGPGELGAGIFAHYPLNNDNLRYVAPKLDIIRNILQGQAFPFWNPFQGYGMELWATGSKDPLLQFLVLAMPTLDAMVLIGCVHMALGQVLFYGLARTLGQSRAGACLAALAFGGCGYWAAYLYDQAILGFALFCVGILIAYARWRRRGSLGAWAAGALCTALAIAYGRPSGFLYFLIFFAAWQIHDAACAPVANGFWRDLLRSGSAMLLMGVTGLALAAPFVWPFFVYISQSGRDLAFALAYRSEYMRWDHVHAWFFPSWQTSLAYYLPVAGFPLAWAALRRSTRGGLPRFLGWTLLAVVLLQFPLGLFDLLRLIPGHEGAWSPVRFLPMAAIAFGLLTGAGFDALFALGRPVPGDARVLKRFAVALGGLMVVYVGVVWATAHTEWSLWEMVGVRTRDLNVRLGWGAWATAGLAVAAWLLAGRSPRRAFALFALALLPGVFLISQTHRLMHHSEDLLSRRSALELSRTAELLQGTMDAAGGPQAFRVHTLAGSLYANLTLWSGRGIPIGFNYESASPTGPYTLGLLLHARVPPRLAGRGGHAAAAGGVGQGAGLGGRRVPPGLGGRGGRVVRVRQPLGLAPGLHDRGRGAGARP